MINYIIRRILIAIPTLLLISVISFIIIQLPPGDYLDQKIAELEQRYGSSSSMAQADQLRKRYGLDQPVRRGYWSKVQSRARALSWSNPPAP